MTASCDARTGMPRAVFMCVRMLRMAGMTCVCGDMGMVVCVCVDVSCVV